MERRIDLAAVGGAVAAALTGCSTVIEDGPSKTETVSIEERDDALVVYEEGELDLGLFENVFDD